MFDLDIDIDINNDVFDFDSDMLFKKGEKSSLIWELKDDLFDMIVNDLNVDE